MMSTFTPSTTTTTASTTSSSSLITVRVLAASTGVTYRISLHPAELTVANIRNHLAAAVPNSDQILLLGPPYKVPRDNTLQSVEILSSLRLGDKEDEESMQGRSDGVVGGGFGSSATQSSQYQQFQDNKLEQQQQQQSYHSQRILSTAERSGARRLFLFSKQALSENAPDPPPCNLGPMDVRLPLEPPGSSPLNMAQSAIASQPLHQALSAYERQFMLYLSQGRVLADAADLRLQACKQCVQEQAVMARALRAAVSNLSDHFNGAARTRSEFTSMFQTKTSSHMQLLQKFELTLSSLASIPLHPALVNIARGSGRIMESLLDTVPVERERAWAQQCQTSHDRLMTLFGELDSAFSDLGTPSSREEETRQDLLAEDTIQLLSDEVQGAVQSIRDRQAQRVEQLTADHSRVLKIIMDAISAEVEEGKEDEVQKAFTPLRQISNSAKDIVPNMEEDDQQMKMFTKKVADAKTDAMKRMKVRLREVSLAQSSIQRVLSSVGVLKAALTQQSDNMVHLEHVAELATSYRDFLSELRRRRAYGLAVTANSTSMMERLAIMRGDEVKAREKFLRGTGRHLMPPFFEIFVPTLATPPPLFTPQMPALAEMDTLPDIGRDDTTTSSTIDTDVGGNPLTMMHHHGGDRDGVTAATTDVGGGGGGVSSASSLTADTSHPPVQQLPQQQQQSNSDNIGVGATGGITNVLLTTTISSSTTTTQHRQQQENEHLIVSANDNSGNNDDDDDVIMDVGPAGVEDDAEKKTLAYENAVLRQSLERMGGKAPQTYIDEARANEDSNSSRRTEIIALQKELELEKTKTKLVEEELVQLKQLSTMTTTANNDNADEYDKGEGNRKQPPPQQLSDKISHSSFEIGDVGLFMPTGRGTAGGKRTFLAFHTNCPHRYLSIDNIKGSPDFVLGRIVYQEELVATGESGTIHNPYGLHNGTKYWVLTVEILK